MIRGLAIYAVILLALVSVYSAIAGITLDYALRVTLLIELVIGSTFAAVAIARRAGRQRWTPEPPRTHRDRLPVPRVDAEVVEPASPQTQRPQIAAPQAAKELSNVVHQSRISRT